MPDIEPDETSHECPDCGDIFDIEADGGGQYNLLYYCVNCFYVCQRCDNSTIGDDSRVIGNETWCDDCANDHAFFCERCNNYLSHANHSDHYFEGSDYCDDCIGSVATWCEDHEEFESYSDGCGDNNRYSQTDHATILKSYNYKPEPVFYGTDKHGLFIGIELEIESPDGNSRQSRDANVYAHQELELGHNYAYMKQDGSLDTGFEIVTYPFSYDFITSDKFKPFLSALDTLREDHGMRSWDIVRRDSSNRGLVPANGLHLHVSRAGFKNGLHIHKFLYLIYSNVEGMVKFAGRVNPRYATFQDVWSFDDYGRPYRDLSSKSKQDNNNEGTRHSAVNMNNKDTIELRWFRGTLNPKSVLARIELAHSAVEYTRTIDSRSMVGGGLTWEGYKQYAKDNIDKYPNLYPRMVECEGFNLKRQGQVLTNA